jgi:AcrR family transcriptional regulator
MATTTYPQRKRMPGGERKAVIEEAAGKLFGERGYSRTTLDQIAAASNVTKPVLYRHYDSKRALYLELIERHRRDLPAFFERVPADLPPERRIEAILEIWFAYVEQHGYVWKMIFRDSGGDAKIQAARRQVQDHAWEVLAGFIRAQKGLSVPGQEVEPLAEFLRTGGAGLALWSLDHPEVPREALVGAFARVVRGLIDSPTRA